jgi:hypothetical protein
MAPTDPAPNGSDGDVFGGLPRSRPQRRSAKRDRPASSRAKAGTASAKPAAGTSRKRAVSASAKAPKQTAARATQTPPASPVPPAGYATPGDGGDPALHGLRLLTTAIEAVGELFVIGLTATSQALRQALHRLPRP